MPAPERLAVLETSPRFLPQDERIEIAILEILDEASTTALDTKYPR